MTARLSTILLRSALLLAVVASTAMFVDYRSATPAFCSEAGSGCAHVRDSAYSSILGVDLPTLGLLALLGLLAMSLWATTRTHKRWLVLYSGLAALGAVGLIGLQLLVIKAVCAWCMVVDVSCLVVAGAAFWQLRTASDEETEPRSARMVWAFLGATAVAVPLLWGQTPAQRVVLPAGVSAVQVAGKVNIVQFTDFECPYCRRLHDVVEQLKKDHTGRMEHTRLMRPLSGHKGAEPAALAYLCTPPGQQDAVAHKLYEIPPETLTDDGVAEVAVAAGVDATHFRSCFKSPETRATLDQQIALFKASALRGLPSTYVDDELVMGADEAQLRAAVDRALSGAGDGLGVGYMFGLLGVLLLAGIALSFKLGSSGAMIRQART